MHKGTHLRDGFQEYLDFDGPPADFRVEHNGRDYGIVWLLGKLWTCTDILPWSYCDQLDIPAGSTYARAAQMMKAEPERYLT